MIHAPFTVQLGDDENEVYYRGLRLNIYPPSIFWECVSQFQQMLAAGLRPKTVLDIGAHEGSMSFLAAHHGAKEVVAVDPCHGEKIRRNREMSGYKQVQLVEAAVCREKKVKLYRMDHGGMQSILYSEKDSQESIEVPGISFAEAMDMVDGDIDLLKVDVEGAEYSFLIDNEEVRDLLSRVRFIDLEIHPLAPGNCIYDVASSYLPAETGIKDSAVEMVNFIQSCGLEVFAEIPGNAHILARRS